MKHYYFDVICLNKKTGLQLEDKNVKTGSKNFSKESYIYKKLNEDPSWKQIENDDEWDIVITPAGRDVFTVSHCVQDYRTDSEEFSEYRQLLKDPDNNKRISFIEELVMTGAEEKTSKKLFEQVSDAMDFCEDYVCKICKDEKGEYLHLEYDVLREYDKVSGPLEENSLKGVTSVFIGVSGIFFNIEDGKTSLKVLNKILTLKYRCEFTGSQDDAERLYKGRFDIYYENGNDGTAFDWNVNDRLCEFMIFNKEADGLLKCLIYKNGDMSTYIYDKGQLCPNKTFEEHGYFSPDDVKRMRNFLYAVSDHKRRFDMTMEQLLQEEADDVFFPEIEDEDEEDYY